MKLTSYGAAEEVTGSCHLIEVAGHRILLECGLIQGLREEELRNQEPFPFPAKSIDAVVLSHAHIDHSGRLPMLIKAGFAGPIYTQHASVDLCRIMLKDSGYINEKDAEWENRKRERKGLPLVEPIYTSEDGEQAIRQFQGMDYDERRTILPGVEIRLRDAGHILGAAIVELWLTERGETRKLVFSGDLGHNGRPILRNPATIETADFVLMESTYGDRLHRGWQETYDELATVFDQAREAEGNILIPAFAVGRAQALIYLFARYRQEWGLDRWQIFLDSPMAIEATEVHFRYSELYRPEARKFWQVGSHDDVSDFVYYSRTSSDSMRINQIRSGAIIIAGSGMCTGGRIRHHLKHNVWRDDCHIIVVGYQGRGTLGRALVDGVKQITLWGEEIQVAATIHTIGGLSAHADQAELIEWYSAFRNSPPLYLVHGEPEAQYALKQQLAQVCGISANILRHAQAIDLLAVT
jgi:metallo-beta-lactamase family protein